MSATYPIVVIGAGVSGLSCAQTLMASGAEVLVVERARGVGGRCATRRLDGQPVDLGVSFLHGQDPTFLDALGAVDATPVDSWPRVVEGSGAPCQPDAFAPAHRRLAYAEGVSRFPKQLARGLTIRLSTVVAGLEPAGDVTRLHLADGERLTARTTVLALAAEQTVALLPTADEPSCASAAALLKQSRSRPCLTLVAVYPEAQPAPAWQLCLPERSKVLQLVSHDSSKRAPGARLTLVLQASARWSREHEADASWPDLLLAEAARLLGGWTASPTQRSAHRWEYARTERSAELASPMLMRTRSGARVGLCGERFWPGGGVEGAFISGRRLAERILREGER